MKAVKSKLEQFGHRLKAYRVSKEMTAVHLGQMVNMNSVQMSRLEKGIAMPTKELVKALADALDQPYSNLAGNLFQTGFNLQKFEKILEKAKVLPDDDKAILHELIERFIYFAEMKAILESTD